MTDRLVVTPFSGIVNTTHALSMAFPLVFHTLREYGIHTCRLLNYQSVHGSCKDVLLGSLPYVMSGESTLIPFQ